MPVRSALPEKRLGSFVTLTSSGCEVFSGRGGRVRILAERDDCMEAADVKSGYAVLGTNDLSRSRGFFDRILIDTGFARIRDSESGSIWGSVHTTFCMAVKTPFNGQPATVGNGTMVALALPHKRMVDAVHERALNLGAVDEGPPGYRGEAELKAYFAYFRDLDGNKLAVYHIP